MKTMFKALLTAIIVAALAGCGRGGFRCVEDGGGFRLISDEGAEYTPLECPAYFPDEIFSGSKDGILSKCPYGYIIRTSSDYCLYVDDLRGGVPYYMYRTDYRDDLAADGGSISGLELAAEGRTAAIDEAADRDELIQALYSDADLPYPAANGYGIVCSLRYKSAEYPGLSVCVNVYNIDGRIYVNNRLGDGGGLVDVTSCLEGYMGEMDAAAAKP